MTWRRVAGGLLVVVVYLALAGLSARLSPIARRPVLDGLGPPAPYQWVTPPPELAAANEFPATGAFVLRLRRGGSEPGVFLTSDQQITLTVDAGTFASHGDDRTVKLRAVPVDPATLEDLPAGVTAFGNAIEIRATYEPSGDLADIRAAIDVVLIYPATQALHASTHSIFHSTDGSGWTRVPSQDAPGLQQIAGTFDAAGSLLVAGRPTPNPLLGGVGRNPLVVVLLVGAGVALVVGGALLARSRSIK